MKSAIIGLGVIGKVHYEVLKAQDENIVALCDTDFEKLADYEEVKKYFDYKNMLDNEEVDVVHVCTPHYLQDKKVEYAFGSVRWHRDEARHGKAFKGLLDRYFK